MPDSQCKIKFVSVPRYKTSNDRICKNVEDAVKEEQTFQLQKFLNLKLQSQVVNRYMASEILKHKKEILDILNFDTICITYSKEHLEKMNIYIHFF